MQCIRAWPRTRPRAAPARSRRHEVHVEMASQSDEERVGELRRLIDGLEPERAQQAFAHPSTTVDRASSYERLEFLGDSVLGFAVATSLFEQHQIGRAHV